jgi:hypothetical protein
MIDAPQRVVPDPDWWRDLWIGMYRRMEGSLSEDDWAVLAAEPGFGAGIAIELIVEDRRLCRRYLRELAQDADTLDATARLLLFHRQQDGSDLALILLKQRVWCCYAMAVVRLRKILGLPDAGRIDLRGLTAPLQGLGDQLRPVRWGIGDLDSWCSRGVLIER